MKKRAFIYLIGNIWEGGFDLKQLARNCQAKVKEYDNRYVLSEENLRKIGFIQ